MEKAKSESIGAQHEARNKKVAEYLGIGYDDFQKSGGRVEQDSQKPNEHTVYFNDDTPLSIISKIKGIDTTRNFVSLPPSFFDKK